MLELARHPEHIQKLRDELAPYMPDPNANVLHQAIANLDHLNGIIYEALRLYPPVPTAIERLTPAEGIEIGGIHVPGNMTVWCPQYAIGRSKNSTISSRLLFAVALILMLYADERSFNRGRNIHARLPIHPRTLVPVPGNDQGEIRLGAFFNRYGRLPSPPSFLPHLLSLPPNIPFPDRLSLTQVPTPASAAPSR